jgi:hypothetical protein
MACIGGVADAHRFQQVILGLDAADGERQALDRLLTGLLNDLIDSLLRPLLSTEQADRIGVSLGGEVCLAQLHDR